MLKNYNSLRKVEFIFYIIYMCLYVGHLMCRVPRCTIIEWSRPKLTLTIAYILSLI